jgi:hypothetical protein
VKRQVNKGVTTFLYSRETSTLLYLLLAQGQQRITGFPGALRMVKHRFLAGLSLPDGHFAVRGRFIT